MSLERLEREVRNGGLDATLIMAGVDALLAAVYGRLQLLRVERRC